MAIKKRFTRHTGCWTSKVNPALTRRAMLGQGVESGFGLLKSHLELRDGRFWVVVQIIRVKIIQNSHYLIYLRLSSLHRIR